MTSTLRALLVEDSEDDAALIVRELRKDGRKVVYERIDRPETLAAALARGEWDVVIADYSLPHFNGLEALKMLQERALDVPFILVSGSVGEETAVAAMRAGVHDYVMKDKLSRLLPAVRREIQEAIVRRERARAREALEASLREKETLLKEIHHRVKNNLQIVHSLLSLHGRHVRDPKAVEGLTDCRNRVKAMALVHEKLYQSKDLARIDFAEYLRDLTKSVMQTHVSRGAAIRLEVEAEEGPLSIDEAVPCGLIAYELVSNGLKHAFPGGRSGRILVSLRRAGERLRLAVSDDGVGFPQGMDFYRTESLGLQLVRGLAGQLGGALQMEGGSGTRFVLEFTPSDNAQKKEAVS